jgi:hypothetical protein
VGCALLLNAVAAAVSAATAAATAVLLLLLLRELCAALLMHDSRLFPFWKSVRIQVSFLMASAFPPQPLFEGSRRSCLFKRRSVLYLCNTWPEKLRAARNSTRVLKAAALVRCGGSGRGVQ